ncbi:MAG: hypothetical protein JO047_13910, partial [Alphaproteobacteria bacterium]|nr:hypothetical protein [Alphaproteobacteria bacterium]
QVALFSTPHLASISRPETLTYSYRQEGTGGFTDQILVHIVAVNPDHTKEVSFDFLTGDRRVFFPGVDHFSGNPLLMLFLENDVREMRDQTGIAANYYRNRIRQAFVDRAQVASVTFTIDGKSVAAQRITVQPFADDQRLDRMPEVKGKTYSFVLADQVPGALAELSAEEPANPETGSGVLRERITFVRTEPLAEEKP